RPSTPLFLYEFSSPPPSHLPPEPMAVPNVASPRELTPSSIPASKSRISWAGLRVDGSLPRWGGVWASVSSERVHRHAGRELFIHRRRARSLPTRPVCDHG